MVAETCLRFSPSPRDYRYDELFSAGLVAANAAIDAYDPHRGLSFATFARMVIRRRLVDQYRHQVRSPEQPVELEDLSRLANVPSAEFAALVADREELVDEMQRYATLLADV
jgi:RNA polymerase sigma factor